MPARKRPAPYLAVGNEELGGPLGETVVCPRCRKTHPVEYGADAQIGQPTAPLAFYRCGDQVCLAGINGRRIHRPSAWVLSRFQQKDRKRLGCRPGLTISTRPHDRPARPLDVHAE
jgi:hypothetical protein